jgi:hypothetical protein
LGRREEAARSWARYLAETPGADLTSVGVTNSYKNQTDIDHWTEGLLKAGLKD